MKLAIEVTTCGNLRAGVGYYTEHLVDAVIATRGREDEVVLLSNCTPAPELTERWAPHLRVSGHPVRALWMQKDVPGLLAESHADFGIFPNYVVPFASPCPTMVVVHDLALLRLPQYFTTRKRLAMVPLLRRSIATASVVATVSEASRDDILELLHVPEDRIELLRGAAHPFCAPASDATVAEVRARHGLDKPYILTVGTLEPRKNLPTLLEAFEQLRDLIPHHELVVVGGRGWKDRPLMRALERHQSRVRWLGYAPQEELSALYSGADVFVYPSTMEGFGLPVLEAMACGAPVVAADVPALREVGGSAARLVSPTDANAFARAILETLGERASRREAGLLRARDFSWTDTAHALWERARRTAPQRVSAQVTSDIAQSTVAPSPLNVEEWGLLGAVVYADLFDAPLRADQLERATMGAALTEEKARRLCESGPLSSIVKAHPDGLFALTDRQHLFDEVPARKVQTRQILNDNRSLLSLLGSLPFVRSLSLSGGLAHDNPGTHRDIDLFVIAAGGHAYTAYTLLFLATKLTGTRHIVCPNYLIDEHELAVAYNRDLFTAHQLASARPMSGHLTYETWCHANVDWVREFFPGFAPKLEAKESTPSETVLATAQRALEVAASPVAPAVESLLRWAWRLRWRPLAAASTRGDVVLANGILKLHLSDYRKRVLAKFGSRLEELRKQIDLAATASQ